MKSRNVLCILLGVLLVLLSFVLTPKIDSIRSNDPNDYPFFYATHLPPIFYVAMLYLILCALYNRKSPVGVVFVLLLAVLLEFSPVVMLKNPWVPDQYIFSAEPAFLMKEHHIATFHYVDTTPGIALTFAPVLLASGSSPMVLWQFAPVFGVSAVLLVILIARRIRADPVVAGLLYLAFTLTFQTNIFHRQTFSFVLFLLAMLIILQFMEKGGWRHTVAYIIILLAMVISHPGTPAFWVIALGTLAAGMIILKRDARLLPLTVFSAVVFLVYNFYINAGDLVRMTGFVQNAMSELFGGNVSNAAGLEYLTGYTPLFSTLMDIRLYILLGYVGLASVVAIVFVFQKNDQAMRIAALVHFGFIISTGIFMFGGTSFLMRPLLFVAPTGAIVLSRFTTLKPGPGGEPHSKKGKLKALVKRLFFSKSLRPLLRVASVVCLVVLLLMLPILRYGGIPYLHPPSEELSGKLFLDTHYSYLSPMNATERNVAWGYSLLIKGEIPLGEPTIVYSPEKEPSLDRNFFLMYRYTTRDGYWLSDPTWTGYLDDMLQILPQTHNLVYESDEYHKVFLIRK
jgi:hypothetical protein